MATAKFNFRKTRSFIREVLSLESITQVSQKKYSVFTSFVGLNHHFFALTKECHRAFQFFLPGRKVLQNVEKLESSNIRANPLSSETWQDRRDLLLYLWTWNGQL